MTYKRTFQYIESKRRKMLGIILLPLFGMNILWSQSTVPSRSLIAFILHFVANFPHIMSQKRLLEHLKHCEVFYIYKRHKFNTYCFSVITLFFVALP